MTERIITDSNGRKHITNEPQLHPPQRTWVGLTDEEIVDAYDVARVSFKRSQQGIRGQQLTSRDSPDWHYAKALEAKLKEKNT